MINSTDRFHDNPGRATARGRQTAFALAALLAALLSIYANSFHASWQLDDFGNIIDNPNITSEPPGQRDLFRAVYGRGPTGGRFNRPLSYLSFALNFRLGGDGVLGFHLVNFAIHYATAAALFFLVRHMLSLPLAGRRNARSAYPVALLAAFFWATHPIQVTAVTYIVQRMAALAALFTVLSIHTWSRARTCEAGAKQRGFFGLCLFFGICALASKENAAMLPVSILLYDLLLVQGVSRQNLLKSLKLLSVPLLLLLGFALWQVDPGGLADQYRHRPFSISQRLLTEPRILFFHLRQFLYPTSDCFTLLHDVTVSDNLVSPWTTLPAMAGVALAVAGAAALSKKAPLTAFSALFFFCNHAIESSVIPLELIFEHRNYLPGLFVFAPLAAMAVHGLDYFSPRPAIQWLAALTITVCLAAQGHTTYLRNAVFDSPISLWSDNVEKSPALHRPRHNLGKAFLSAGKWEQGVAETRLALSGKVMARPNQKYLSHFNLGTFFLFAGKEEKALSHYRKVLELLPGHPGALDRTARIMIRRNRLETARALNAKSLATRPETAAFHVTLGHIRLKEKRAKEAFSQGIEAWKRDPGSSPAFFLLGEACRAMEKCSSAEFFFTESIRQNSDQAAALLALVELHTFCGKNEAAAADLDRILSTRKRSGLPRLLEQYAHQYNFLGPERQKRLERAVLAELDRQREVLARHIAKE